jgi:tetratricopeptide (TPR) repeat protein
MTKRTCILLSAIAVAIVTMGSAGSLQYSKGNDRLKRGDYQGAVEALTKALEKDPLNFGALLNRGMAYEKLERFEKAIGDYTRALEVVPGFARAYHCRGHVYSKTRQYERAIEDYDEVLKHSDNLVIEAQGQMVTLDKAAVQYDRGNALYQLKKLEQAVASYGSAIALDGRFAAAYNNRGVVYSELGDKKAACVDRSKACELGFASSCKWIKENC